MSQDIGDDEGFGLPPGEDAPTTLPLNDRLDRHSTRLYMLAVRHPNVGRMRMIAAGIPADTIDAALEFLMRHGLVRETAPDSWEAIPPDIALPSLALTYEARAQYLRDSAGDLAHVYQKTRMPTEEGTPGIAILRNTEDLVAATEMVTGAATGELWAAYDDSPRTAYLLGLGLERHRERLTTRDGAPLRRRTTFDTTVLQHPRAGDVILARAAGGEEIRLLGDIPFSVLVADETCAVVDLTSFDTSGAGSLLVHDRRVVLGLRRLCETWWGLATPMAQNGGGEVDRDTTFILSMLAAGATDSTMATQAGLSQRTVERRVRGLMNRLGATTRFQAGVLAARRGWI